MLSLILATALGQELKIVGGENVEGADFPEVVAVLGESNICTGTLIHPEWILTAAHCWDGTSIAQVPDGNTTVFFGNNVNGSGTTVAADRVVIHEQYLSIDPSPNSIGEGPNGTENDVALVHLAEPFAGQVMALNTAEVDDSWIGLDVTFIGFGITQFDGSGEGTKRFVASFVDSYEDQIVRAFDQNSDASTCQGDSGGPGVRYQGDGYIQFSVTAFGVECGTTPGSHMRVDAYIPWIEDNIAPATVQTVAARPPTFECSHQLNPGENNSIALGVVPMDLRCQVTAADPERITRIDWSWGDGDSETVTDLRANHVYDAQGVYSLSACMTSLFDGNELTHCVNKVNHVNACGVPDAAFEASPGEGLTVDLVNKTPLRAYTCISNATWEVFAGEGMNGEPVKTLSGWEPALELEDLGAGEYTIVLNVGGLGGTGAAIATVDVGRGPTCSTLPGASWALLAPLALLGLRRRGSVDRQDHPDQ